MKTRLDLADWLPKNSVAAELGVFKGEYSSELIKRTEPREFYMVDLFDRVFTSGGVDGYHEETADLRLVHDDLRSVYADKPNIHIVRSEILAWLNELPVDFLDWAYLDASHSYPATIEELPAMRRVVRPDGYLCGHDYHPDFQLKAAVDEFIAQHRLNLDVWDGDRYGSFCIKNVKSPPPLQSLTNLRSR
jgi:SAM-dependent methyltransferase